MTVMDLVVLPGGFDQEQIEMLCDAVGVGSFKDLLNTFFRHTDQALQELDDAVRGGDCDAARQICHSLKSSALQMGCGDLAELIDLIAKAIKADKLDRATGLLTPTHEQFRRVREVLTKLGESL